MKSSDTHYIGADIAKNTFEVFFQGQSFSLPNRSAGFKQLITMIAKSGLTCHVCCEATGSYGVPLLRALIGKGIAVSQVNPVFIKDYIRSFGRLAKTDRIDARFIASYYGARGVRCNCISPGGVQTAARMSPTMSWPPHITYQAAPSDRTRLAGEV